MSRTKYFDIFAFLKFLRMKFNCLFYIFAGIILMVVGSCSTKIDINEPYKEQTVVYGLLNQTDTIQYIKINKAFLGEGNNFEYAQIPDSFNYNPADLRVKLEVIKNKLKIKEIPLRDTILSGASKGVFSKEKNIIYYTKEKLVAKENGEFLTYRLVINNLKSGNEVTAETNLIDRVSLNFLGTSFSIIRTDGNYVPINLEWNPANFAKTYNVILTFFYREGTGSTLKVTKSVDWNLGEVTATSSNGTGQPLVLKTNGEDFISYLKSLKSSNFPEGNFSRIADSVQYTLYSGGDELYFYQQVNKPSSGLLLEKPLYGNIKNGLGIFSCRGKFVSPKIVVSDPTKDFLATQGLGF
jgi:hypothetical protein